MPTDIRLHTRVMFRQNNIMDFSCVSFKDIAGNAIYFFKEKMTPYDKLSIVIANTLKYYYLKFVVPDFLYWCLNRHLCILPERFAKKDLNLVIVCHKDVTS